MSRPTNEKYNQTLKEFSNFKELLKDNSDYNFDNESILQAYQRLFFLMYLSQRFETKRYLDSNYYDASVSFLIEGFISLCKKIPNGSQLLLRSSIENFLKSILYSENLEINERSYSKNDITILKYYNNQQETTLINKKKKLITKLKTVYGKLSAISHSATRLRDYNFYAYFSDLLSDNNQQTAISLWNETLSDLCEYATYQCFDSFKNWEYFELNDLLSLSFKKSKAGKITDFIIDGKE